MSLGEGSQTEVTFSQLRIAQNIIFKVVNFSNCNFFNSVPTWCHLVCPQVANRGMAVKFGGLNMPNRLLRTINGKFHQGTTTISKGKC